MTPFASSINSVLQTHLSLCGPSRASVSMIAACQCSLFVFVGAHYYMFSFASAQIDDLYGGNWQVKDVSRARIFPKHFPEIKFVIRPRYSRDVAADERQLTSSFFCLFIHIIFRAHCFARWQLCRNRVGNNFSFSSTRSCYSPNECREFWHQFKCVYIYEICLAVGRGQWRERHARHSRSVAESHCQ